jgi:hypothetical protein
MNETMDDNELIEKFHSNELSGDEASLFLEKYNSDKDFKKESDRFTKLFIALNSVSKKQREKINLSTEKHLKKSQLRSQLKIVFRAAAIFIPIIILANIGYYHFFVSSNSNEQVYASYFKSYKSEQREISFSSDNTVEFAASLRSVDLGIIETLDQIGNYHKLFLFGLFCMENNRFTEAIFTFKRVLNSNTDEFKEDSEWYLGLCLLKTGEQSNALKTFTKIADDPKHKFNIEAQKVIQKIN